MTRFRNPARPDLPGFEATVLYAVPGSSLLMVETEPGAEPFTVPASWQVVA